MAHLDHRNLVIVPGMPRAATTSLFHCLGMHPQLFTPWRKEPCYFSQNFRRGEDWYRHLYADVREGQVAIDASTEYFMIPAAVERMIAFDPKMRAVMIVRDPVDWVISLYAQIRRVTRSTQPFEDFVLGFDFTRGGPLLRVPMGPGFVRRQIERFGQAFGPNLLLVDYELFQAEPERVLAEFEAFVGVKPFFTGSEIRTLRLNARSDQPFTLREWLMSRESLLGAVERVVPSRLLDGLRRHYASRQSVREALEPAVDPRQREIAEQVFAEDRRFIEDLFAPSSLVLGDGAPWPPPTSAPESSQSVES